MKLSPSTRIKHTDSGLEFIEVNSFFCSAKIFLQGAQLTEFTPKGEEPLIWVSKDEDYQLGKSIRGGIPICWPWFGVNENEDWPIHGVARTNLWRAEQVNEFNDHIEVSLSLPLSQINPTYWPHKSSLKIVFSLSDKLKVSLINTNLGDVPFSFTQALHSYFPTPAIEQTQVNGLQGARFEEFGKGPFEQDDLVSFSRETDMVYNDAGVKQEIITPKGIIAVSRENSTSCILWNPWIEKAKRLSNFRDDEFHSMLCLEAANVREDAVTLAPGESHTLVTTISWKLD